jgi:hypothetical protein
MIRQQAKARMLWGFFTGSGEKLETKTDPEGGQTVMDEPNHLLPKAAAAQAVAGWPEMANSRKYKCVCGLKILRGGGEKSLGPYSTKGGL